MSTNSVIRRKEVDLFFLHNCFGSFFGGVLNWFADEFYPRFQYKLIGTYDKSVKFFQDKKQFNKDPYDKLCPSLTLDPFLDFSNEERAGKFLWQHKTYAPGIGMRLWKSIDLREQDILITPVFSRYQGTFEIIFWLESVYELIDFRVALLQFCGGYQRWLRPEYFWSYIILPEQIADYEKETGEKIDWSNTKSDIIHIDTINKQKLGVPIALDPIWRLDSCSDSSSKYGGDQVAEYKMSASFTYEINIPTYLVLSRGIDPKIRLSFSLGHTYTKYPLVSPFKILKAVNSLDVPNKHKYSLPDFKLFTFVDEKQANENLILQFDYNSVTNPRKLVDYNYIVSGKLIYINQNNYDKIRIEKSDIIYMDSYRPEYLHVLRRSRGAISANDSHVSEFFSKCIALNRTCVCHLSNADIEIVKKHFDTIVTLDSVNKKLYKTSLEVEMVDQDSSAGYEIIKRLKEEDPEIYTNALEKVKHETDIIPGNRASEYVDEMMKRLVNDRCDGFQTRFYLDFILDDQSKKSLLVYVNDELKRVDNDYIVIDNNIIEFNTAPPKDASVYIGGTLMEIKSSKLISMYEFTEEDIDKLTSDIIVKLPYKITRQEDIVLVSYNGRLEYEKDYIIDEDNITVHILIEPKKEEIVQFFYYE